MDIIQVTLSDEQIDIIKRYAKLTSMTVSNAANDIINKGIQSAMGANIPCIVDSPELKGMPIACSYIGIVPDYPGLGIVAYENKVFTVEYSTIRFI